MRTRRRRAAPLTAAAMALLAGAWLTAVPVHAAWGKGGPLAGLGTGRIWAVAASPVTAGTFAAATDDGVYLSTDGATSWSPTALTGVRVWTVGFDARDGHRIFAGTDGRGIEVSTNAGATWTDASAGLTDRTVRTMAFGLDGIAAGTNHGVVLSPDGTTWHDGGLDQYAISSIAVAANSPSLVLVAAADRGDLSNGFLFRFGAPGTSTWQALQSGLPSQAVATTVVAGPLSTAVTKRPLVVTTSKGVFHSGDSGTTWTASTGVADTLTLTTATFSPLDPQLVYAGADSGSSTGGDLLRSTDGGATFSVADQGLPNNTRQVESIAVSPTTPPVVVAALDPSTGGIAYGEADATAPAPPTLVPESPGATVPATLATPPPTPTPSAVPAATAAPAASGGVGGVIGGALHWPIPLVFEVLVVLVLAYLAVRWRQRYYVEGPP